jgi:hypothetical protein
VTIRLQLALVLAQPGFDVITVTADPVDLGADGVQALLDGTVVALEGKYVNEKIISGR